MTPGGDAVQLGMAERLRYERLIVKLRWVAIAWILSLALFGEQARAGGVAECTALAVILVCSAYFTATAYRKEKPACFGRRAFVIDFASVTLAMALSGGVQSLAVALYWPTILTASLRFRGRDALGVALLALLSLIWIGTIHHGSAVLFEGTEIALRAGGFVATALAGSALARRLRYEATRRALAAKEHESAGARLRRAAFLDAVATIRREMQDPDAVIQAVLAPIRLKTDATTVALLVADHDRGVLRVHAAGGASAERLRGLKLPYDGSLVGECALWARRVIASAAHSGRRFQDAYEARHGVALSSVLCVPLSQSASVVGVLALIDRRGLDAFTEEDLEFALSAAEHVADALRDALSRHEGHRQITEMAAFHGLSRVLADGIRREEITSGLLEEAMKAARADSGCVLLLDPDTGRLRPEVVRTPHHAYQLPGVFLGEGAIGRAAMERLPAVIAPLGREPLLLKLAGGRAASAALLVPLVTGNLLAGVVVLIRAVAFESHALATVRGLVEQAAITFENEHLRETVRSGYLKTIRALAETVDAKDPYTRQHSERVARYSRAIAEELRLPAGQIETIEVGALLHDIGKIGISEAVLAKPGRLTAEEFAQMKLHPVIGAKIVAPLSFPSDLVALVRHHHERLDGRGYPDGLGGTDLALSARIVTVADCFDAMGSDRAYRRALSLSSIIAELRRSAGSQFDPEVVDAFLSVLDRRGRELVPRLP